MDIPAYNHHHHHHDIPIDGQQQQPQQPSHHEQLAPQQQQELGINEDPEPDDSNQSKHHQQEHYHLKEQQQELDQVATEHGIVQVAATAVVAAANDEKVVPTTHVEAIEQPIQRQQGIVEAPAAAATISKVTKVSFIATPDSLDALIEARSLAALKQVGGTRAVVKGLGVDPEQGLFTTTSDSKDGGNKVRDVTTTGSDTTSAAVSSSPDDSALAWSSSPSIASRRSTYGPNILPSRRAKSILSLAWTALKDKVLLILCAAAVVSLALGIYQAVGVPPERVRSPSCPDLVNGCPVAQVDWVEGVAIVVAIAVCVGVGALNDWQKDRQFIKLEKVKDDRTCVVVRDGHKQEINTKELVVGDICVIVPGDVLPVDGLLLANGASGVRCDESGATGESERVEKVPEVAEADDDDDDDDDQEVVGGEKSSTTAASGDVIVTVTAPAANHHQAATTLGSRRSTFSTISTVTTVDDDDGDHQSSHLRPGMAVPFAAAGGKKISNGKKEKEDAPNPFLLSGSRVTDGSGRYVVLAVGERSFNGKILATLRGPPEITPLQRKLGRLASLISKLGAIAGGLLFLALFIKFLVSLRTDPDRTPAEKGQDFVQLLVVCVALIVASVPEGLPLAITMALALATRRMAKQNLLVRALASCETMASVDVICTDKTGTLTTNRMSVVAEEPEMQDHTEAEAIAECIATCSTAFAGADGAFVGDRTEVALLERARALGWPTTAADANSTVVDLFPFSSDRKCMSCVVRRLDGGLRLYVKGAPEVVYRMCGTATLPSIVTTFATRSLRTLALAYRDLPAWPLDDGGGGGGGNSDAWTHLTPLTIVGIQDPLRPGVTEAVNQCARAGVRVVMCTGDNIVTARAIAAECKILTEAPTEWSLLEGSTWRTMSDHQRLAAAPHIQVLARCSPEDKRVLALTLRTLGSVVAMTGDGANDAPALKAADVGFSMGLSGTEIAKEASDVVIMDDAFPSLVKSIIWGRCVADAVKKFLQFQLSVNVSAVIITFVSAVAGKGLEGSVFTAVQILWVALIMDTFAALALATDPAEERSLDRRPENRQAPVVTPDMLKQILGQAAYQVVACLTLHFAGLHILRESSDVDSMARLDTLVFNVFVFCQVFGCVNARRLGTTRSDWNVFSGIHRNYYFLAILAIMAGGQVLIVMLGGVAFNTTRINGRDWAISIVLGAMSLPVGLAIRAIPTEPFARALVRLRMYPDPERLPVSSNKAMAVADGKEMSKE